MIDLLTSDELAEKLKISPSLLRTPSWRSRHGILAVRVGRLLRFSAEDVQCFLAHARELPHREGVAGTNPRSELDM